HAEERKMQSAHPNDCRATFGGGGKGQVNGDLLYVGRAKFLQEHGVDELVASEGQSRNLSMEARGFGSLTAVFVAVNDKIIGVIGLADPMKETAAQAVTALRQ